MAAELRAHCSSITQKQIRLAAALYDRGRVRPFRRQLGEYEIGNARDDLQTKDLELPGQFLAQLGGLGVTRRVISWIIERANRRELCRQAYDPGRCNGSQFLKLMRAG